MSYGSLVNPFSVRLTQKGNGCCDAFLVPVRLACDSESYRCRRRKFHRIFVIPNGYARWTLWFPSHFAAPFCLGTRPRPNAHRTGPKRDSLTTTPGHSRSTRLLVNENGSVRRLVFSFQPQEGYKKKFQIVDNEPMLTTIIVKLLRLSSLRYRWTSTKHCYRTKEKKPIE